MTPCGSSARRLNNCANDFSAVTDSIRVVLAVCLMADDPELVLADVLSKDRLDCEVVPVRGCLLFVAVSSPSKLAAAEHDAHAEPSSEAIK